jgi:hypothetical protein
MARYFFDTPDNSHSLRDELGLELDSLEEARDEATRGLADLAKDVLPQRSPPRAGRGGSRRNRFPGSACGSLVRSGCCRRTVTIGFEARALAGGRYGAPF